MKFKISKEMFSLNTGVVAIKMAFFVFNLGSGLIFPYLTLQARNIGLSYDDISIVYGTIPALIFFSAPVTGLICDLFGYRLVLILNIVLMAMSGSFLDLTPRYYEATRSPSAVLYSDKEGVSYNLAYVEWAECNGTTLDTCQNSSVVEQVFPNLSQYLQCDSGNDIFALDENYAIASVDVVDYVNGTYCRAETEFLQSVEEGGDFFLHCDIAPSYPLMESCFESSGSHAATFWTYYAIRAVYQWTMNSAYSLFDGTALRLANDHNSHYALILLWASVAITIAPFIAGEVIKDSDEEGEETDYNIAFYLYDGFLFLTCLICLKLKVTLEKSGEKVFQSLKALMTPAAINFFAICAILGFLWGIHDSYLFIYLQEELGASSQLISYMVVIGSGVGVVMTLIARPIVHFCGQINLMVLGIWVESSRLIIYSYVTQSPPYFSLYLHAFDAITVHLTWISQMHYGYKITHPDLVGTMASTVAAIEFIIAKGIASLIGGQVIAKTSWESPELFRAVGAGGIVCGLLCLLLYHLYLKKYHEHAQIAKNEEVLAKIRAAKEAASNDSTGVATIEGAIKETRKDEEEKVSPTTLRKVDSVLEAIKMGQVAEHDLYHPYNPHKDAIHEEHTSL